MGLFDYFYFGGFWVTNWGLLNKLFDTTVETSLLCWAPFMLKLFAKRNEVRATFLFVA